MASASARGAASRAMPSASARGASSRTMPSASARGAASRATSTTASAGPRLNLVLIHPDIPGNTGCVGRTALAAGCRLHLIHPMGFDLSDRSLKRAGLDYWQRVDVREHASWEAFVDAEFPNSMARPAPWLFTTHASNTPLWDGCYQRDDYLLFGSETQGAPEHVHEWVRTNWGESHRVTLPMQQGRSINLAACVGAAVYEATRQLATQG